MSLREDARLQEFAEAELGRLLEHEARHGAGWSTLLRQFLAVGGNKAELARVAHRNRTSLYPALRRLEELVGHPLDDPASRLSLGVALLAYDQGRELSDATRGDRRQHESTAQRPAGTEPDRRLASTARCRTTCSRRTAGRRTAASGREWPARAGRRPAAPAPVVRRGRQRRAPSGTPATPGIQTTKARLGAGHAHDLAGPARSQGADAEQREACGRDDGDEGREDPPPTAACAPVGPQDRRQQRRGHREGEQRAAVQLGRRARRTPTDRPAAGSRSRGSAGGRRRPSRSRPVGRPATSAPRRRRTSTRPHPRVRPRPRCGATSVAT